MEFPRIAQKPPPSFPSTPAGKGHRPLFMVLVRLPGHTLSKTLVAIEAIAEYCSKPGGKLEIPDPRYFGPKLGASPRTPHTVDGDVRI